MKILLTEEERMIKNMFRDILQENSNHKMDISWDTLTATGAFEMTLPVDLEGANLDFGVEVLLAELLGEHAATTLFFDSIFGFALLEAHNKAQTPKELIGKKIGIMPADHLRIKVKEKNIELTGSSEYIAFANQTEYLLFIGYSQYFLVKTKDMNRPGCTTVQNKYMEEQYCYDLTFDQCCLPVFLSGKLDIQAYDHNVMKALLRYCAYFTGACKHLIKATIDYTRERHQFGKPIIQFQTISHRLASLKAETTALNKLVIHAAFNMDSDTMSMPKIKQLFEMTQQQAQKTAKQCMQFHGAHGMTSKSVTSMFYRRIMINSFLWSKLHIPILERSYVI